MINFIDTSLFKPDARINVLVYSDNKERAMNKIDRLVRGETIIEKQGGLHNYRVIIKKDGIEIALSTVPLSTSARGYKSQFAIIDKVILDYNNGQGLEILHCVILPANNIYSHQLKEDFNPEHDFMRVMLF